MLSVVLFVHSWLRYALFAFGIALGWGALGAQRAERPWSDAQERLHKAFLAALDTQVVLGVLLFVWLSPLPPIAFQDLGGAMKDATLRFFTVEHPTTMLLAVVAAHVGRVKSKRGPVERRQRTVAIVQLVWLVLTLAAIPWPGLDVARPLFRV